MFGPLSSFKQRLQRGTTTGMHSNTANNEIDRDRTGRSASMRHYPINDNTQQARPSTRASARARSNSRAGRCDSRPPTRSHTAIDAENNTEVARSDEKLRNRIQVPTQVEVSLQEQLDAERSKHRQAVADLDRILRQGEGFNQLPDDVFISKTRILRHEIRNFSMQHFETGVSDSTKLGQTRRFLHKYSGLPQEKLKSYASSSSMCAPLVQTLIWAYLAQEVFGRFLWASSHVSESMDILYTHLMNECTKMPPGIENSSFVARANRGRASTTTLILESMSVDGKTPTVGDEKRIRRKFQNIMKHLTNLTQSEERVIERTLTDIFDLSIELDREMSQQVAQIEFYYTHEKPSWHGSPLAFKPEQMILPTGPKPGEGEILAPMTIAPSLCKWGDSRGQYFGKLEILLKMEVSREQLDGRMKQSRRDEERSPSCIVM